MTDRMIQAAKIIRKEVIDHLIIDTETYYSFVDSGLFEELLKSEKWVPRYVLEDRFKAAGKAEGEKQKAIEIARNMKAVGIKLLTVQEVTGLSKKELESLD